jgi:hypothetical protein
MTLPLLLAYVHLVASVLVVGYFLFWLIMMVGLPRLEPQAEVAPLTAAMLAGARWPPAGVPWKLRLTLPGLGWAFPGSRRRSSSSSDCCCCSPRGTRG